MFIQGFKLNDFLDSFFLNSSFLGNGLLLTAPPGILWEFLSWLAWQLVFNPAILLFQGVRMGGRGN